MRILCLAAAALSLFGCHKQQLAPDAESQDPGIQMSTNGLWQSAGAVHVEGTAQGLESVTVNGVGTAIADGAFATDIQAARGVNLIEAIGQDARGDTYFVRQGVLAGEFRDPNANIADALTIRVNRSGLLHATNMVSDLIDPVAISSGVTALNPIYSDSYGVLGWDAVTVEANLVDIGFGTPYITPDPRPGVLLVEVAIPNLEVHANVNGEIVGIDFDEDAWIGSDSAVISANVLVGVTNGQLDLQVVAPTVQLNGFWYDVSLIPGDIESYILVDTIRGALEGILVEKLEEMLPSLLGDALGGLDISFQTEVLGKQISIGATFADASIDAAGIQLTTDVAVSVPVGNDKPYVGYLGAPSAVAQPSMADDIGLSVSDDLLNSVFFQVWRGGILSLSLDSTKGEIEPIMLAQLGARDVAKVYVDAQLPPVIVQKNGEAQVQLTELAVRVETPGGENGEYLDLSVTAFVDLQLSIVNGNLTLDLGTPTLVLDVRDSDWGADNNAITNLLADQLPIQALLILLGDIEFPLPTVAGIGVNNGDAWRESSGVYTTVGINL
ncbi:MAG: hypothetical protein H6737_32015 [Alphaproteobacteria bacterium]|nr:hypothetical protein [Alphaproteobacteria bacterium]